MSSGSVIAGAGAPSSRPSNRGTKAAAIVTALVVGSGALAGLLVYRSRTKPAANLRQPRFQLTLPRGVVIPDPGFAPSVLAVSPDGERVAFVGVSGGIRLLYVRDRRELDARPLGDTEGAACPFFSPDGRFIGFGANDKLKKVAVEGGPVVTLADAAQLRGGSWGEDGTILFTHGRGGLLRVAADGGDARPVTQPDSAREYDHRWPHVLPGGRAALFDITRSDATTHESRWSSWPREGYGPSSRVPASRVTRRRAISCSGGTARSMRPPSTWSVSPSRPPPHPYSKEWSCGAAPVRTARAGSCTTTWRERGLFSSRRGKLGFPGGRSLGSTAEA